MRVTKYTHSCLLIEKDNVVVLVDPGNYTAKEQVLQVGGITALDYILITHEHQDHVYVPLLKDILAAFPKAQVVGNDSVKTYIAPEGIPVVGEGNQLFEMKSAPHEDILGNEPENTLFHIFGELTHPGDSFQLAETNRVLALPIQAPWGSMVQAVKKAAALQPEVVIPIHDWHWRDEARVRLYEMATSYLREQGVEFLALESGKAIEV